MAQVQSVQENDNEKNKALQKGQPMLFGLRSSLPLDKQLHWTQELSLVRCHGWNGCGVLWPEAVFDTYWGFCVF